MQNGEGTGIADVWLDNKIGAGTETGAGIGSIKKVKLFY